MCLRTIQASGSACTRLTGFSCWAGRPATSHFGAPLLTAAGNMPWESAPPFILIGLAIAGMGHFQGWIHLGLYGKPKAVCIDDWDRQAARRDDKIKAQAAEAKRRAEGPTKKGWFG